MMYLTTTSTVLVAAMTLLTTAPSSSVAAASVAQGFYAEGKLNLDMTLPGNTKVIGAHLHTGSSTTNGPVAVIFCGVDPLPAMNGPCTVSNVNDIYDDRYLADWESQTVDPDVAFTSGVNNATAVANATSIADGAASSVEELGSELRACTDASTCNVYINIHTNYSYTQNPALGLARGQLQLITCPDNMDGKDGYDSTNAKCFSASVTSANTNNVPVPNLLADDAGIVTPLTGDVLVVWYDDNDSSATDEEPQASTASTAVMTLSVALIVSVTAVIGTVALILE